MSPLLLSAFIGVIPMFFYAWFLYHLDRYEKEPLPLIGAMFGWGALIAAGGAFVVNTATSRGILFLTRSDFATQLATSTLVAPVVEETLKGAAVLLIFLFFRSEFDSALDGIVYAGIAALGFGAVENIWYIHTFGFQANGYQGLLDVALIRVFVVGWQHPFYTAFTGLGFAFARQARAEIWRTAFPFLGWSFAVAFHLLHNLYAVLAANLGGDGRMNLFWDWSGYLGLLVLILLLIKREQHWMKTYLAPERDRGLITPDQYQTACSAWRQGLAALRALFQGNPRQVRRFYQVCGDLMHKLRQASLHEDDPTITQESDRLRDELNSLSGMI